MNVKDLNCYGTIYGNYINSIFKSNAKYRGFSEVVKWHFSDEDIWISATASRKDNIIRININWFLDCIANKKPFEIEYFLIHKMRHIFQHINIQEYKEGIKIDISEDTVKKWIEEETNYKTSVDKNGNEGIEYFKQSVEMDAYAFSYALMSYKYKQKYDSKLYKPDIYKNELKQEYDDMVSEFIDFFLETDM